MQTQLVFFVYYVGFFHSCTNVLRISVRPKPRIIFKTIHLIFMGIIGIRSNSKMLHRFIYTHQFFSYKETNYARKFTKCIQSMLSMRPCFNYYRKVVKYDSSRKRKLYSSVSPIFISSTSSKDQDAPTNFLYKISIQFNWYLLE